MLPVNRLRHDGGKLILEPTRSQLDVTDDGFLSLMDEAGNTKDDVKKPDGEIGERIDTLFTEQGKDVNVIVMSAMGEEVCVEAKEGPKSG